jgi:tRNA-binding protein
MSGIIDYSDFLNVDIRVGTVVDAKIFEGARKPAFQVWVDFGPEIGIKKTSAQITAHYKPEKLVGTQICGVINFAPKQIGNFMSEFLVLGFSDANGDIILIRPDSIIPDGNKLH